MRLAVIFDVDGTLLAPPSLEFRFFCYLIRRGALTLRDTCGMLRKIKSSRPYLLKKQVGVVRSYAETFFQEEVVAHIWFEAVQRMRQHRAKGYGIILLSGTLDFLLLPLHRYLKSEIAIATKPEVINGRFTGNLVGKRICGKEKAERLLKLKQEYDLDLRNSYGYANEFSDHLFLNLLGHPIAVNPDRKLKAKSEAENWTITYFKR